jgi:hypothetical protein
VPCQAGLLFASRRTVRKKSNRSGEPQKNIFCAMILTSRPPAKFRFWNSCSRKIKAGEIFQRTAQKILGTISIN